MNTVHHKNVAIWKVVLAHGVPKLASAPAVDRDKSAYWMKEPRGDFGFVKRIPKTEAALTAVEAIQLFVKGQTKVESSLREQAAAIANQVYLASQLLLKP